MSRSDSGIHKGFWIPSAASDTGLAAHSSKASRAAAPSRRRPRAASTSYRATHSPSPTVCWPRHGTCTRALGTGSHHATSLSSPRLRIPRAHCSCACPSIHSTSCSRHIPARCFIIFAVVLMYVHCLDYPTATGAGIRRTFLCGAGQGCRCRRWRR